MNNMTIKERVNSLVALGRQMDDLMSPEWMTVLQKAEIENPWFTKNNIIKALTAIRDQYLNQKNLERMIEKYHLDDHIVTKKIGLVLAGNIPLVGFHDVMCCYLTGHHCQIKYSDKDTVLMSYVIHMLVNINPNSKPYFSEVQKLKDYDAAIATGSNSTATHFKYYFGHVPHIIRQNKNSIAVLTGDETNYELQNLGEDVFSFFGLGCRNVSKVLLPRGYDISKLFVAFEVYADIIHHNKYKNNYDYNVALNLLNKEPFLQNDLLIIKEASPILSRIGSLHYEYYDEISEVVEWIKNHANEIQCIVSRDVLPGIDTVSFGNAQCPDIDTFADGVDTIQFLLSL